jgi:amidohydrolase
MKLIEKIKRQARKNHKQVVDIRRHLHQHPELSYKEKETAAYVARQLKKIGIPFKENVGGYGLVGMIEGRNSGKKVIALRADMDALPIQEANDVPYKSKNEGVMHACGHDVHTASLLGAADILYHLREEFEGSIKLIFQPAEELFPGGASLMIKAGVLGNPAPASILGQHVHPPLEVGKVGMRPGYYMASADEIYVTVEGRGGHGALPQDCIDPILMTSQILVALQQIVSRHANPVIPSVLTFGHIASDGGATNIIPNRVFLKGTFRTMDEKWRAEAHQKMKTLAEAMATGMGGRCEFRIDKGYPALFNEEKITARSRKQAIEFLGPENVVDLPIRMTAEDFAYYSHELPGCFYRLGTGNPSRGITSPVHTDTFDIDENALETGAGLMAWLAIKELEA